MASSNQKVNQEELFCAIRKKWIIKRPEEVVRQCWIKKMGEQLGYSLNSLALEPTLSSLPHLKNSIKELPIRRADILCFAKNIHPDHSLYPLLLIECKATPLTRQAHLQVVSYNHFIQAPFIAVANQEEIKTGWFNPEKEEYSFISSLPTYEELISSLNGR